MTWEASRLVEGNRESKILTTVQWVWCERCNIKNRTWTDLKIAQAQRLSRTVLKRVAQADWVDALDTNGRCRNRYLKGTIRYNIRCTVHTVENKHIVVTELVTRKGNDLIGCTRSTRNGGWLSCNSRCREVVLRNRCCSSNGKSSVDSIIAECRCQWSRPQQRTSTR